MTEQVQANVPWYKLDRMITTAEGVATEEQCKLLIDLGCTQMQGFLFSPARPASEVRALLRGSIRRVAASA